MKDEIENKLNGFKPISLSKLNSNASFLERVDIKYLFSKEKLKDLIPLLEKDYYILKINDNSIFSYDNTYMDTKNHDFYKEHQEERKNRTKVRTRLYKDSNIAFFEYKQKVKKITRKFRYEFPPEEHGTMTKGKIRFFEGIYMSLYGETPEKIIPAIRTKYNRITLVSKDDSERITIDFNIKLKDLRNKNSTEKDLKNTVIFESKSKNEKCLSYEIVEKLGAKKANHCSKYCLGLIYNNLNLDPGIFTDTMKKIEKIGKK